MVMGALFALAAVLSAGAAVAALWLTKSAAFSAIAGLWTMSAGSRRTLWRESTWQALEGALYLPRYLGEAPLAAALTELGAPTSLEEAAWLCMEHQMTCELYDLAGREVASVGPDGAIRARRARGGDIDGARYLPTYAGSKTAERLTRMAVWTSVDEAVEDCVLHGVRCDLSDARGKVVATIDPRGTVRVPPRGRGKGL